MCQKNFLWEDGEGLPGVTTSKSRNPGQLYRQVNTFVEQMKATPSPKSHENVI